MLFLGFVSLMAAIVGSASQRLVEFAGLLLFALAVLCIWFGWKTVADTRPALQFGRSGLWTRKLGDVKWQGILLEFTRASSGKAGSFDFLSIVDKNTTEHLDSVIISGLDKPLESVKASLAKCAKAQFKR